ncbi:MAG: M20 family metallopeptidase [SAR324 cluster bacterium]|nr:M20 family metallopeptidase [SAR324 cluster bacterium]
MQEISVDDAYQKLQIEISRERLIATTSNLVRISSENPFSSPAAPGCREQEIAHFYHKELTALGFDSELREVVPGRPNVWGTLFGKEEGFNIMLAGHLDTVGTKEYKKPFDPRIEEDRLYGRGSCDMKAALAAYLEVARVIAEANLTLNGNFTVAGVVDEEYQMIGSRDFGTYGPRADFCIIGEPNNLKVCPAHKGQFSLFFRTFGKAVHSSIPGAGINAIEKMSKVVQEFEDYNERLSNGKKHELCGHGTFSPGVIRGGSIVSTVPDFCEMEVDRRILPNETREQVIDEYRLRLEKIHNHDPEFRYEISEPSWDISPLDTPVDNLIVKTVTRGYYVVTGKTAAIEAFSGATDAPNFACPAVICGPGSLLQAHSLNEYVEIEQIVDAAKIYLYSVLALLLSSKTIRKR